MPTTTDSIDRLAEFVQRIASARDIKEILSTATAAARELTGADGTTLVLRDGLQCVCAAEDSTSPLWKGQRSSLDHCVSGWAILHCESVIIPDIYQDPRVPIEDYRSTFVRSLAIVPIGTGTPVGAIESYWATSNVPTAGQLRALQILADSAAIGMQNVRVFQEFEERIRRCAESLEAVKEQLISETTLRKQLEAKLIQLALTDELTGFNNRRGFLLRAEQMLKVVNRFHTNGWLIFIDLEGLKQVNDRLGCQAGVQLVGNAAKVLRESFRDSDILARIGGDEFIVFTTGTSTPVAEIESRLAGNIEHFNRCYPGQPSVSMSIGVVRCDPQSVHSLEEMIYQADAAMYIEKRKKRARRPGGLTE